MLEQISPSGALEESTLVSTIDKIVNRLAAKFRFGYHDIEDIKQQGRYFALEAINKWDKKRPLDNFLYTHVRNRLINYKRDNFSRYDKPCLTCPFYDPHRERSSNECSEFPDRNDCDKWRKWERRNTSKKNIMRPSAMKYEPIIFDDLEDNELLNIIKDNISLDLRSDLFRMLDGVTLSKQRREKVQDEVLRIIREKRWQILED